MDPQHGGTYRIMNDKVDAAFDLDETTGGLAGQYGYYDHAAPYSYDY